MREAIGSTWLIYLVITFLIVYIFFMGFVMNYASAYRAANYFVTQIETCQGLNDGECNEPDSIKTALREKYRYLVQGEIGDRVCCIDIGNDKLSVYGSVYRVKLPVVFEVPLIGKITWIKVTAESKTIQRITCSQSSWKDTCK